MPGFARVDSPTPSTAQLVAAGSLGYGWMDDTQALEGGHRFLGGVAFAYSPAPFLSVGAELRGHLDRFPNSPDGGETNLYGEPRINLRAGKEVTTDFYLGVAADVRVVGAEAPSVEFTATSPSFRALGAWHLAEPIWLGAQLGIAIDRSSEAVPDASLVSVTDRRTLGASSFDAMQWGLGGSYRMGSLGTELLGELSGEMLLGTDLPSPARLTAGARHPLSPQLSFLATADFALSTRPLSVPVDELFPIDPRATLMASVIWRFDGDAPKPQQPPPPEEATEPAEQPPADAQTAAPPVEAPVEVAAVTGTVVDEGGRPLADVEVTLSREGEEPLTTRTFADGRFEFSDVPVESVELSVQTPGYDTATTSIAADAERTAEIVMRPAVPAGQLRGKVLELNGTPVPAQITITPGEHTVAVRADGSFELELPPGKYTVVFEHEDFRKQQRKIRVHDRGVVILNIALIR